MATWEETDGLITQIRALAMSNTRYFESNVNPVAEQFIQHFNDILKNVTEYIPIVKKLSTQMERFDYDAEHVGNGYRSLFNYYRRMLGKLLMVVDKVTKRRSTLLFGITKNELCNEIKSWAKLSAQMGELLKLGIVFLDNAIENSLLVSFNAPTVALALELSDKVICMDAYLDRPLGFQYADSLAFMMNVAVSLAAGYSDVVKKDNESYSSITTLISTAYKYMFSPELRATKALEALLNADITFCKKMWECNENTLMRMIAHMTTGKVVLCKMITLREKSITVNKENTKNYNITKPEGKRHEIFLPHACDSVNVKCITNCMCESMLEKLGIPETDLETHISSGMKTVDTIMFHIHGGGFIANNSFSHELYLRIWTKELGIPIFSVHYSLSPEAAFPKALEECYYAYVWMLENKPLGWSGKYMVYAGDSAGGNLIASLVIKCIMTNIRLPDAMFSFYPVLSMTALQSPSRILSLVDPILNISAMQNCVMAYCGIEMDETTQDNGKNSTTDLVSSCKNGSEKGKKTLQGVQKLKRKFKTIMKCSQLDNPLLSPLLADDTIFKHFPSTYIFASECDPLLDDSVTFAKRLRNVGIRHELLIVPEVPHGFMSLRQSSSHCLQAFKKTMQIMKSVITDFYSN